MRNLFLVLAVVLAANAAYAQCNPGWLDLIYEQCYCGGSLRLVGWCKEGEGGGCAYFGHVVYCAYQRCDFRDDSSCELAPEVRKARLDGLDTIALVRPSNGAAGCGAPDAFDRWFSEKLRSKNDLHRSEAGGE